MRNRQQSVSSASLLDSSESRRCPGALLQWNMGSFFDTYPLSLHSPGSPHNPGYCLSSVSEDGTNVHIRANRCKGEASSWGQPCIMCSGLSVFVDIVRDRAQHSVDRAKRLNNLLLSHSQLSARVDQSTKEQDKLRFTVCCILELLDDHS